MKDFYGIKKKKIKNGLAECGYVVDNVQVNESNRRDLAEYQYNGIMSLAKKYKKNPIEIANELVKI